MYITPIYFLTLNINNVNMIPQFAEISKLKILRGV